MFSTPHELLDRWRNFSPLDGGRRRALSALAARDCIESVLRLRHPSADRFAEAVSVVDEWQRRALAPALLGPAHWWWGATPPVPFGPPDLGTAAASSTAAEIWGQATTAGLAPVDSLTFGAVGASDVTGLLRFEVVMVEPLVVRPWIDVVVAPVEQAYYRVIGAAPPEIFTATLSAVAGRLVDAGVHLPFHAGPAAVKDAVARHVAAFTEVLPHLTPGSLMDDLLRQQRFSGSPQFEWRLPLALAVYGRGDDARRVIDILLAEPGRRPHSRSVHELLWLRRRLP